MNKRGHVINAVLLALGIGYFLEPAADLQTVRAIAAVSLPLILGALFPDVDTAFGEHRKTFHNLPVLALFAVWPFWVGNLQYVWIGVATHYVLDLLGTKRGIAFLYPLSGTEFDIPVGVSTSSRYADLATVAVTGLELFVVLLVVDYEVPVHELPHAANSTLGI